MKDRNRRLKILALIISVIMLLSGCSTGNAEEPQDDAQSSGKVMILYTSDMHCGIDEGMFAGISGERRVRNVTVGGKPLDPEAAYTVAGQDFHLLNHGDGYTMFDGTANVIMTGRLDSEVLSDYIKDTLGGEIGAEYADPYGQGRITVI